MPAYPLPQRPGTQGSSGVGVRTSVAGANGLSFLSGSGFDTNKGAGLRTGGSRVLNTASGGSRPPLPGGLGGSAFGGSTYAHVSSVTASSSGGRGSTVGSSGSIPPLFSQPTRRLNTAPSGATRPAPPPGRSRADLGTPPQVSGASSVAVGPPSSKKRGGSSGASRRPPSSGSATSRRQTVPLLPERTNSASAGNKVGKSDFHKGLVSALHEVLKKQRHGVFPQGPVSSSDVESRRSEQQANNAFSSTTSQQQPPDHQHTEFPQPREQYSRPGTGESQGSRQREDDVEALIRQRKMQWAQNRWRNVRDQERKEAERREANTHGAGSPGGGLASMGGIGRGYRVDTPTRLGYEEADEYLDEDTVALLHNLERMERNSRQSIMVGEGKKMKELERSMDQLATRIFTATGSDINSSECDSLLESTIGSSNNSADSLKTEGNRHYEAGNYYLAHRCYTQAMDMDTAGLGGSSTLNPLLLTNRAACNMSLLNYDTVIKDCLKAVELDPHLVKGYARMAHAYALQGYPRQAAKHYASSVHYGAMQGNCAALLQRAQAEAGAVDVWERVKQLQAADNHDQVVQVLNASFPFIGDPPVALLRLRSLIITDPAAARNDITRLLQSLEHPACSSSSSTGSQESLLMYNSITFYADVLALAAKASFYCGQHYVNIARKQLGQCLALRRDHRTASALEKNLQLFETRFQQAALYHQQSKFSDAHSAYTQVLAVDPENKKLLSSIYMCRAEVSQRLANIPAVISDCTSSLDCDPTNFKALCRRAKCFGNIGDFARAVRDLERATRINSAVQEDLDEMKAKQAADHAGSDFFGRSGGSRPGTGSGRQQQGGSQRPQSGSAGGGTNSSSVFVNGGRCHYTVLGLPRFVEVAMIRQQYRRLTLRYHPDKCVNETTEERKKSELRFKEISSSYSALCDSEQKRGYDNALRAAT